LVGYPIVRLPGGDVQRYVHLLEQVLIATCSRFGVDAQRGGDNIGVWTRGRKIGSVGIGVRRGVAYHGVALNVAPDLSYFEQVVPCREASLRFTALAQALPLAPSIAAVAAVFRDCFAETFGYREVTTVGL
jgi:lipoate-protein ligase B